MRCTCAITESETPELIPLRGRNACMHELGELMVPDRFVDVFQGRAPRSVLAKHYTGRGLERLERIYDKSDLKVLEEDYLQ